MDRVWPGATIGNAPVKRERNPYDCCRWATELKTTVGGNAYLSSVRTAVFILLLLSFARQAGGQRIFESYTSSKARLRTGNGPNDFLPYNQKGYTLVLPDTATTAAGVVIALTDNKFDLHSDSSQQIYPQAAAKGLAVLYLSTGVPVDLYFSTASLLYVDTALKNLFVRHHLPNKNIVFLGVNLAGHRALKYLEFCGRKKSSFNPDTKAVVLCDGVLDWVRQWYEGAKGIRDRFAESAVLEGKLVTWLLQKNLGGTPKTQLEKYLNFSTYSYFDETARHVNYFTSCAVRAYTEPAPHYWMNAKRKTTFDTNFPDMVGIVNELKLAGNSKSELVVFNQDKSNTDRRNPNYTWGLVNKAELIDWLIAQMKQ